MVVATQAKLRKSYAVLFCVILFAEIYIALFINDSFVRPYVGDMLVTVLICCFCRVIIPKGVRALPVYVFILAAVVETGQYFDVVKLLGLDGNKFFSVVFGRTFSVYDLICYAIGCLSFFAIDYIIGYGCRHRHPNNS